MKKNKTPNYSQYYVDGDVKRLKHFRDFEGDRIPMPFFARKVAKLSGLTVDQARKALNGVNEAIQELVEAEKNFFFFGTLTMKTSVNPKPVYYRNLPMYPCVKATNVVKFLIKTGTALKKILRAKQIKTPVSDEELEQICKK